MSQEYHNEITHRLVQELYHDEEGNPIVLTPGQLEIFDCIAGRMYPRVHTETYTQYGKSLSVGLGALTRVSHYPEKWTIIAPKADQAQIIMGYIIDHIFDNEMIAKKFEIDKGESAERIRRERSKNRLTFKMADGSIGGVQVLSAQNTRTKNLIDAILGFGSPNVIVDESSLLQDDVFAGIIRMLGGTKNNFLMQIGNTIYRNHFFKAGKNPRYHKIHVDYRQGIREGRISKDFIQETREEMRPELFRMLYECKYPEADAVDAEGYSPLVTAAELERATAEEVQLVGKLRAGVDAAGGGANSTVLVIRARNGAKVVFRTANGDYQVIGPRIIQYLRKYKVEPENVAVDGVGVGHGLLNYLQMEYGKGVRDINAGERAETDSDPDPMIQGLQFENLRALMAWRAGEWIKKGAKLKRDRGFTETEDIRWMVSRDKKIKVKSKQDMRKDGIESPDTFDALALTFAWPDEPERKAFKQKGYTPQTKYEGGDKSPRKQSGRITEADNRKGFGRYSQDVG